MTKNTLIITVFCIYAVMLVGVYFGADTYIQQKNEKLKKEATDALDRFFDNRERKYVDLYYNAYTVSYQEIQIPSIEQPTTFDILERIKIAKEYSNKTETLDEAKRVIVENRRILWFDKYGSYSKMYDLDTNPETSLKKGWALRLVERKPMISDRDGYYEYYVYPSQVNYKKTNVFLKAPEVETTVQESLRDMTESDNSDIKAYYTKERATNFLPELNNQVGNEYYTIAQDNINTVRWPVPGNSYGLDRSSHVEVGSSSNGYYQVNFKRTQPITYSLFRVADEILENDKKDIMVWGFSTLTLAMLLVITPLWRQQKKKNKAQNESLYEKLIRLCSPTNYMKPYDKEMIDKANSIFISLKETEPDDIVKLKEIRKQAIEILGISFLNHQKITELQEKCNPGKFMTPYHPEKLSLANNLYSRLSDKDLSVDEVEDIEKEIQRLNFDCSSTLPRS